LASFVRVTFTPPPSLEEHVLHQGNDREHENQDDEEPMRPMPHIIPPSIIMSRIMGKLRC